MRESKDDYPGSGFRGMTSAFENFTKREAELLQKKREYQEYLKKKKDNEGEIQLLNLKTSRKKQELFKEYAEFKNLSDYLEYGSAKKAKDEEKMATFADKIYIMEKAWREQNEKRRAKNWATIAKSAAVLPEKTVIHIAFSGESNIFSNNSVFLKYLIMDKFLKSDETLRTFYAAQIGKISESAPHSRFALKNDPNEPDIMRTYYAFRPDGFWDKLLSCCSFRAVRYKMNIDTAIPYSAQGITSTTAKNDFDFGELTSELTTNFGCVNYKIPSANGNTYLITSSSAIETNSSPVVDDKIVSIKWGTKSGDKKKIMGYNEFITLMKNPDVNENLLLFSQAQLEGETVIEFGGPSDKNSYFVITSGFLQLKYEVTMTIDVPSLFLINSLKEFPIECSTIGIKSLFEQPSFLSKSASILSLVKLKDLPAVYGNETQIKLMLPYIRIFDKYMRTGLKFFNNLKEFEKYPKGLPAEKLIAIIKSAMEIVELLETLIKSKKWVEILPPAYKVSANMMVDALTFFKSCTLSTGIEALNYSSAIKLENTFFIYANALFLDDKLAFQYLSARPAMSQVLKNKLKGAPLFETVDYDFEIENKMFSDLTPEDQERYIKERDNIDMLDETQLAKEIEKDAETNVSIDPEMPFLNRGQRPRVSLEFNTLKNLENELISLKSLKSNTKTSKIKNSIKNVVIQFYGDSIAERKLLNQSIDAANKKLANVKSKINAIKKITVVDKDVLAEYDGTRAAIDYYNGELDGVNACIKFISEIANYIQTDEWTKTKLSVIYDDLLQGIDKYLNELNRSDPNLEYRTFLFVYYLFHLMLESLKTVHSQSPESREEKERTSLRMNQMLTAIEEHVKQFINSGKIAYSNIENIQKEVEKKLVESEPISKK